MAEHIANEAGQVVNPATEDTLAEGMKRRTTSGTVQIAQNESLSTAIDIRNHPILQLVMPSGWDAANLTVASSTAIDGTFNPLYDDAGNLVTIVVTAASRNIAIDRLAGALAGCHFIKLRSGTPSSPVNQTAVRTITVLQKG